MNKFDWVIFVPLCNVVQLTGMSVCLWLFHLEVRHEHSCEQELASHSEQTWWHLRDGSCKTRPKSRRSFRCEEWRPRGRVMDEDEWAMMKRPGVVATSPSLRGGLPLALILTSGLPPPPRGPVLAQRWHVWPEEFRNVQFVFGWTETLSLPPSCFTLIHFIQPTPTTGTHAPPPWSNHKQ